MGVYNLISFLGLFVLLGVAWLFSSARRRMNWRVIGWGVGLQLLFGAFIFTVPAGARFFLFVNDVVVKLLDAASAGVVFVFGALALPPGSEGSLGFILAFQALPTIIFFSALMALLYHFRIMPVVIKLFASVFSRLMRISGAEALGAASNIFVGVESALVIRPHLAKLTKSEYCVLLTAGMATVASNVLALYVMLLSKQFPTIAGHLVSASFLSAPAALAMAKILLPETEAPVTLGVAVEPHYEREDNFFAAIITGANGGLRVVLGIVAVLVAVLGLVALFDQVLGWAGGSVNALFGIGGAWSLKGLLGYLFYPFTLVLGIPPADALPAARIIGERLVLTEIASYRDLASAMADGTITSPRSVVIITYALCGFAHVASMAIFCGGVAALAPQRTGDIAKVAGRALLAATLACLMTACVAGAFYHQGVGLLAAAAGGP